MDEQMMWEGDFQGKPSRCEQRSKTKKALLCGPFSPPAKPQLRMVEAAGGGRGAYRLYTDMLGNFRLPHLTSLSLTIPIYLIQERDPK